MDLRRTLILVMGLPLFQGLPVAGSEPQKPKIVKHGTIDLDLVETTPVVFQDRLYRFEYVRQRYQPNTTGDSYFRFVDVATGEPTPGFGKSFHLGSAYVDGDTMIVTGTNAWGGHQVQTFRSTDLANWKSSTITYSWGNQRGVEFLAEASCDGSVKSLLRGFFPETKK